MASIEKRGDLQWQARIRKHGYPAQSKVFMTKEDAQRWAKETELAMERGQFITVKTQRTTFNEVAKMYLDSVTPTKRSAKSETYRIALLCKTFGPYHLSAILPMDVAKFRDSRMKEVAAQTVIHEINTLSVIFEYARIDLGAFVGENPVRLIRKPTRAKSRTRRLSVDEVAWLHKAADAGSASNMRQVITLAIETSMRLGEILELTLDRVDLENKVAQLHDTKNGDSRSVALSTIAIEAIKSIKPLGNRFFKWNRADSFEKTWRRCVIRAQDMYKADCVRRKVKGTLEFLEDLRFHDLRHEAASRLFEKGLNPFEVASMTGHKSMQMLKRYTHVDAAKLAAKLM